MRLKLYPTVVLQNKSKRTIAIFNLLSMMPARKQTNKLGTYANNHIGQSHVPVSTNSRTI